jgi:HK97 family phage major capsid protein
MFNVKEVRQRKADLLAANRALLGAAQEAKRDLSEEEGKKFDANTEAIKKVALDIERIEGLMDEERRTGRHVEDNGEGRAANTAVSPAFKSLGEQLVAVTNAERSMGRNVDSRLYAASGASEGMPSDGGFLVQQDFAGGLLKRTYESGAILSRVQTIPISANSNGLKINTIDESSRATGSRYGGIQVYRRAESVAASGSKPKFGRLELTLKKITGLFYATDELLQDSAALEAVVNQAFPEEFRFVLEDEIVRGDGVSQMLGILNSPCKVSVSKETGQPAKTLVYENIVNMWARQWARSRQNAVWLINQDIEPQLFGMSVVVGTGGIPVFLPPGGLASSPYSSLFGRPVIPVEYCSTLGTEGDIILADFSQYLTIDKGGLQTASSVHVKFLEDETAFRFTYRNDGQPSWKSALTPYKGASGVTLSPFVTLAVRA